MGARGRDLAGAVGTAVLQGTFTTAWIAAEELTDRNRRLARWGMAVTIAAAGAATSRSTPQRRVPTPPSEPEPSDAESRIVPGRVIAAVLLVPVVTVGPIVLRRQLERRWLERLIRSGHPHPHRAVAVRIGVISMLGMLLPTIVDLGTHPSPKKD